MEPVQPNLFSKLKLFISANKFSVTLLTLFSLSSVGMTIYLLTPTNKTLPLGKPTQEKIILTPTAEPLTQKTIFNTPSPSTPTPTIALINPTATWSAFTSLAYSYSIKYPPDWTAKTITQTDPKILEYVVFNPTATKAGTLSITLSYGTRTYLEALALDPQIGETILVASVSSTKKNSKDSNGYKATNVIVPYGLKTIIFNAKNAYISLFNQMLTTLKLSK